MMRQLRPEPMQRKAHQVLTPTSCVSRIEEAKQTLLRSTWNLAGVDEANNMAAHSADKRTTRLQALANAQFRAEIGQIEPGKLKALAEVSE